MKLNGFAATSGEVQRCKGLHFGVLGDFYDASGLGLVLVPYDSLYAVSVPALVDPVAVGEEFSHDHGLAASDTVESS